MYFLDRSNILWVFRNDKLTKLFKIDEIILIWNKHDIEVMIDGVQHRVYLGELLKKYDDRPCLNLVPGRVSSDYQNYYAYSCDIVNNMYLVTLFDYWNSSRVIETNIDAEKYVIFEMKIVGDDIRISYIKKVGNFPITIKRIAYTNQTCRTKKVFGAENVQNGTLYEYIIGGYVKTNKAVYSLINGCEYDYIYPGLSKSISRQGDNYYIKNVCVTDQVEEFDFGDQNTKSARTI